MLKSITTLIKLNISLINLLLRIILFLRLFLKFYRNIVISATSSYLISASLDVWCVGGNLRYPRRRYNRPRGRPLRDSSRSHSLESWTRWLCDRRLQWLRNWDRENIVRLIGPRRSLPNLDRFDPRVLISKMTRMW